MKDEHLLVQQLLNPKTKEKAFKLLVNEYKERLYWHIRRMVLIHEDADDVLQNTFIKVHKNIGKFKGDSKLYSWMYRIATNESINLLQKKARAKYVTLEEYKTSVAENLHTDVLYNGDRIDQILQKTVQSLPEKQQLVFNLKYFEKMTYEEISEILETSIGGLKATYHHAVKKIEKEIKKH